MDTREVVVPTNRRLMSRRDPRGRNKTTKQIPGENNRRTAARNPKGQNPEGMVGDEIVIRFPDGSVTGKRGDKLVLVRSIQRPRAMPPAMVRRNAR